MEPTLSPAAVRTIVTASAQAIEDRYVFADRGESLASALRTRAGQGRYAACADPARLAAVLTADLTELSGDLHLRLLHRPDGATGEEDPEAEMAHYAEQARQTAGGVRSVTRRDGNVAVVDLGPLIGTPAHAGDSLCAAMSLVADADALVLDVRACFGGHPDGVVLLLSHLFGPEPVRLSDVDSREEGVRQFWTAATVPGRRLGPDKPVAVVVGPRTFSGGEAVAFDLQELGRATIVGEPTGGGAHPRTALAVHPQLELTVPVARSVSIRTGENWEGRGVRPDVVVPATRALDAALALVLGDTGA